MICKFKNIKKWVNYYKYFPRQNININSKNNKKQLNHISTFEADVLVENILKMLTDSYVWSWAPTAGQSPTDSLQQTWSEACGEVCDRRRLSRSAGATASRATGRNRKSLDSRVSRLTLHMIELALERWDDAFSNDHPGCFYYFHCSYTYVHRYLFILFQTVFFNRQPVKWNSVNVNVIWPKTIQESYY